MRVGILGAGSVGLGVAASLVKAGAAITLLARGETLRVLGTEGVRITGVLGEHNLSPHDFSVRDIADPNLSVDYVIIATKTYEVAPALKVLLSALKTSAKLPAFLLLQNGWGSAEEAKQIVPPGTPLFSGSVMTGLERLAPGQVRINAHADAVHVGTLFSDDMETIRPLIELAQRGFLPFTDYAAIGPILLTKLLYNICLNPLGALLRCTYGELLGNEPTLGLMEHIAQEGIETLDAARGFARFANGRDYVRGELVLKWLPKVGAHRSSMLQDIEAGRRTEIRYLNGAISVMGRQFGIETPRNDTIVELILAAECGEGKPQAQN